MVLYSCPYCSKQFTHKNDFNKHQNRKFKCFEKGEHHNYGNALPDPNSCTFDGLFCTIDPPESRKKGSSISLSSQNDYHKTLPYKKNGGELHYHNGNKVDFNCQNPMDSKSLPYTINSLNSKSEKKTNTISCNHCQKKLKNRYSLKRHLKICPQCPLTKTDINTIEHAVYNKISKNTSSGITTNTINNTQNNTQNINNIFVVNNNISTPTKQFGKEDLQHLTDEILSKVIECPQTGILKLIKQIHFNKNMPQNHNINMTNKKETYVEVFNGKEWEKQDKKTAIQNMITSKKDIMDDYIEEKTEKNLISSFIKDNYERFSEMLDTYVRETLNNYDDNLKLRIARNCQKLYREIFKQVEIILINNIKNRKLEALKNNPTELKINLDDI